MSNLLFVLGCPRSGKTTLTKKILISDSTCIAISLDSIYYAIKEAFPSLKINEYKSISELSESIFPFVRQLILEYEYNFPRFRIIIEGMELMPREIMTDFNFSSSKIVCLGFPYAKQETLFKAIRENDGLITEDTYTKHLNDEQLMKRVSFYIRYSNELKQECEKYRIPFYDVEHSRLSALNDAYKKLLNLS